MSGSPFGSVLLLDTLSASQGFRVSGVFIDVGAFTGAGVGDINRDGFDDLLVSAPFFAYGSAQAGIATLVFGRASGFTNVFMDNTPAPPAVVDLLGQGGRFGADVAGVGDVNGDGFVDFVITETFASVAGRTNSGAAYLVFGRSGNWSDTNLTALAPAAATVIYGAQFDGAGRSVSGLGDVNGDGFADFVVQRTSNTFNIVLGKAGGTGNAAWSNIDLTTAPVSVGPRISGWATTAAGIVSAGDINGDGFADFAWGSPNMTVGTMIDAGIAYVAFGGATPGDLTFNAGLPAGAGFRILGNAAAANVGYSIASAGDVNGDGLTDLIVGSFGNAWLIFGRTGTWADVDLAALTPTTGVKIAVGTTYATPDNNPAAYVTGFGDLNGDGFDDYGFTHIGAREAYIFYGKASGWADVDIATPGVLGTTIRGNSANGIGWQGNLAGAGDLNGDGFADIRLGATRANTVDGGTTYGLLSPSTGSIRGTGTTLADSIRGGAGNDTLFGYSQNDTLSGGAGDDTIEGGVGNDVMTGGAGNDTLSYANATAGVTVNLAVTTGQNTGGAGVDTATGFENLLGSAFNDTLSGTGATNTIEGGAGNDVLNSGGGGGDTASYAGSTAGVTVSLALQGAAQNTVAAGTDTLNNFVNLLGSAFNDTLTGDGSQNTLMGGAGNDVFSGGAGNDRLFGGEGIDTAILPGTRAASNLTKSSGVGWEVGTGSNPGQDVLNSVERVQFDDGTVNIGFARTEDMAGRGYGDLLFQSVSGGWLYRWQMQGTNRTGEGALGGPGENWVVAGKGDFNADLNADILWQNTSTGQLYAWLMNGATRIGEGNVGTLAAGQSVGGVGDTDGDGRADILLRGSDGAWAVQRMNGTSVVSTAAGTLDATWSVAAVSDFNGDLKSDVLWRNSSTGQLYLWRMDGSTVSAQNSYATPGSAFVVAGTGDLNGDGRADVVIKHATQNWFWGYLTNTSAAAGTNGWLGSEGNGYTLAKIADYTGDDMADLMFFDAANGFAFLQSMNGLSVLAQQGAGSAGTGFSIL